MTSRFLLTWSLGLAFGLLPLAGGSQQDSSSPPPNPTAAADATAQPQPTDPPSPGDPAMGSAEVSAADLADAPATPISTTKPPPNIRPGSPVSEIVRLANSGVDEGVLLAFVTNSSGTFNLQADEIIYLNDIGVPSTVVTAMLQHDQTFAARQTNNPPAVPPPAQVAPQPDNTTAPYPMEAPPVASDQTDYPEFYSSLSPYGNWVNVDGYGPCWQPTVVVVNSGWQPYFDGGHWVYTDCGWYWASAYSWGWAPFHYGRWFHHNHLGWCWTPGRVWAPSWVCWRYSDNYCGWAPLPPGVTFSASFGLGYYGRPVGYGNDFGLTASHYRFVPWHAFGEHHLRGLAVTGLQADQLYHSTVVANRFVAGHNVVINQGVSAARVAAATHQVVEPLKVRDLSTAPALVGRTERVDPSTRTLSVYRPPIAAPRSTTATVPGRSGFTASQGTLSQPRSVPNAPLILRGQQQVSPAPPAPTAPQASSLVVIGRQQNGQSQVPTRTLSTYPQANSTRPGTLAAERDGVSSVQRPASDSQVTRLPAATPTAPPQPMPRTDTSRATPWLNPQPASPAPAPAPRQYSQPNYSAPVQNAPVDVPRYNPAPAYGVQRSYSAPAPSYRSQPSQSYSVPSRPSVADAPRSAPAPAYSGGSSGGARSAPAPSNSGGSSGGVRSAPSSSSGQSSSGSSGHK